MKHFFYSLLLFVFIAEFLKSQPVHTKDGVLLGDRKELIDKCYESAVQSTMDIQGMTFDSYSYCACVTDELYKSITYNQLETAAQNNNLEELLFNEENMKIIMKCAEDISEVSDDFSFSENQSILDNKYAYQAAILSCKEEFMSDPEIQEMYTEQDAEEYCICAINKLYDSGFTFADLGKIEEEDSETFNEIAIPCVSLMLEKKGSDDVSNDYLPEDIVGEVNKSVVSLTDYMGKGYKLKLTIENIPKYFLFDTGASDLVINTDLERELLLNGSLKREDYLGKEMYEMANGELEEAQLVRLNNIKIGDYVVNNVIAAIIENGSLLCGQSFFAKFRKWEFSAEKSEIILYK